jgi:hypothetical protein
MKRFGLPLLLSAGYASLLFGIFSSDFSKEHSFLLKDQAHAPDLSPRARAMENPVYGRENGLADRIALLSTPDLDLKVDRPIRPSAAVQSPESAANQ